MMKSVSDLTPIMMKRPSAELRRVAVATLRDGERFAQGRHVGDHYAADGPLIHVELALAFYGFAELAQHPASLKIALYPITLG